MKAIATGVRLPRISCHATGGASSNTAAGVSTRSAPESVVLTVVVPRYRSRIFPGDFVVRRGAFTFYVPLTTSVLISLAATLVMALLKK